MKKFYLMLLLFVSTTVMGQAPIITMISDGDCTGGKPNVVELYAQGTVDFSNFSIEIQSNANTTWDNPTNLAALGTVTDDFVYIYRDVDNAEVAQEFPSITAFPITNTLNYNGDDRIRIILDATSDVVDQYGEDGIDGSGTAWEYTDGYAKRNNAETPNGGAFDVANWAVSTGALDGLGTCQGGADDYETLIGLGTFTPNTSPTISANPTSLTGFTQFVGTPSPEESFDVSGTSLTDDITITVTTGDYEISETSGGTFGTTITLTQVGGVVSSTTIYVRLNGVAAASPSNGEITLSSAGATDEIVTLEGEILNPAPTVFADPNILSGFSHFVGTPSAEQTFEVSGEFLTDDMVITAPGEYEVSLTSGTGFGASVSLTPATGTIPVTTVYVRLNGVTANYNQTGDIVVSSAGATDENVTLEGETFDYTLYPIGDVTTNDADGIADSLDVYAELRGIVHCIDFDGNAGYNFTIIDSEGDGINVFNFNDVDSYVVTEGDSIGVKGQIDQYNGLTQVFAEEIELFTQGNATETPLVVTILDETTESQLVTLEGLTLVNGETVWPNNGNIEVTDGTNNFTVRVPSASPLAGAATPSGAFDMTGLGGQFDNSTPYSEGYQLFPCSVTELCNVDVATTVIVGTISANATGLSYQWLDCDDNNSLISGETNASYSPATDGNYAVIITDGTCVDTSDCVAVTACSVDVTTTTTEATITATAVGLEYQWLDCDDNFAPIAGEESQSFTALVNGNYAVIITDGACSDTSECTEINTIGLSTNDLSEKISLYPNPVSNELNINSTDVEILSVEIFSATGQSVYSETLNDANTMVSTSSWESGVYFVNIRTNNGTAILKVVK